MLTPDYLTTSQLEACPRDDHTHHTTLPHPAFVNLSLKTFREFQSFKHQSPLTPCSAPATGATLSFSTTLISQIRTSRDEVYSALYPGIWFLPNQRAMNSTTSSLLPIYLIGNDDTGMGCSPTVSFFLLLVGLQMSGRQKWEFSLLCPKLPLTRLGMVL